MFAVGLAVGLGRSAAAGALLAALYGLGNLAGSFLVTVVPLCGDPDGTVLRFSSVVALTFAACDLAPSYPLAGRVRRGGLVNGPFFATALAAWTEYAPPGGRAQVFVTMAAAKVAAAGRRSHRRGCGPRPGPGGAGRGGLLALGVTGALALDRRAHPPQPVTAGTGRRSDRVLIAQ